MLFSDLSMNTKTMLIAVADCQTLTEIAQVLGDEWETVAVSNEVEALAQLELRGFDALLVDFNLGSPDASQLLNQALEKRPEMFRFLFAHEADLALVAAYVSGPHEILPKPIEPTSLKSRIERAVTAPDANLDQGGGEPNTGSAEAPSVPAVYAEVLKALDLPNLTKSELGEMIAGDAALSSEVVRLAQSAYVRQPCNITDPVEAVEALGLEAVKALVMALRFLAEHSQSKPGYLDLEKIWQHSIKVGQLARDLMLFEKKDRVLASEALIAGLLHDLGKVVLASNFDDLYSRVHSLARKQPVALWEIEKEMFGASHGEIGGCLVGMWNMPSTVVQAVALHHEPPLGEDDDLSPLAAVHIANVLEHEIRPSDEFRVSPQISVAFLNEIGMFPRLPVWRAVFATHRDTNARPEVGTAATNLPLVSAPVFPTTPPSSTANQLPTPAEATRTATSGQPGSESETPVEPFLHQRRWIYAGAAAVVLALATLWIATRPPMAARARTSDPTPNQETVVVSPIPAPEPAPAAVAEATSAVTVSEEAPATNEILALDPAAVPVPESGPTVTTDSQVTATNAPTPTLATAEKAQPDFRLSGIFFTVARPAAIVNGQTVYVGDWVGGATVTAIEKTYVMLQVNGHNLLVFLHRTN